MYEVDSLDRAIALEGVPQSDTGAPLPVVLADDTNVLLGYLASTPDPTWDGVPTAVTESCYGLAAIIRFEGAFAHLFGPPNDEALQGHPLANRGLGCYGAYEVIDSSWLRKMERMKSIHPMHDRNRFLAGMRHFIFTFHDNTFECAASGYSIERLTGTRGYVLDRMCELLNG